MPRHQIEWDRAVHTREQFPKQRWPQVAFAGRSNVGKSSLLNRLTYDVRPVNAVPV